jgi:hypothetical protein
MVIKKRKISFHRSIRTYLKPDFQSGNVLGQRGDKKKRKVLLHRSIGTYLKQDLESGNVLGQGGEFIAPRLRRPEFLLTVVSRRLRERIGLDFK